MSTPRLTLAELRAKMNTLAFNRHLGLRVAARHADGVTIECAIVPEFGNMHNTLHGGVTATLIDVAGGFSTLCQYGGRPAATVEMKLNYFLPITGEKVSARGKILRAGNTLCVTQVDVFTDQKRLAATGLITYMLLDTSKHKQ